MYPLLFELGFFSDLQLRRAPRPRPTVLALRFALHRARGAGLDGQRIVDLGIIGIISAVAGAKLMLLVVDFDRFTSDLSQMMVLVKSGGVFYGGLLLAVPVCWWYIRRTGLPLWTTCDLFAPGIALAQGVGRMGCLLRRMLLRTADGGALGHHLHAARWPPPTVGTPLGIALHPTQDLRGRRGPPDPGRPARGGAPVAGVSRPDLLDLSCCCTAWPGSSSSSSAATRGAWSSTLSRPRSSSPP